MPRSAPAAESRRRRRPETTAASASPTADVDVGEPATVGSAMLYLDHAATTHWRRWTRSRASGGATQARSTARAVGRGLRLPRPRRRLPVTSAVSRASCASPAARARLWSGPSSARRSVRRSDRIEPPGASSGERGALDPRPWLDERTVLVVASAKLGGPPTVAVIPVPMSLAPILAPEERLDVLSIVRLGAAGMGAACAAKLERRSAAIRPTLSNP